MSRSLAICLLGGIPLLWTEVAEAADAPSGGPAATSTPPVSIPSTDAELGKSRAEEVTVVGTSVRRSAGSAHMLRRDMLDRFRYDDPHKVLAAVPGVYVRGEDGQGLRPNIGIRGVSPDRSKKVTLMEDGILFAPAPYSAPAAYYFPMIDRMQLVRVLKGPGAIAYGPNTIGGAIDLITRDVPFGRTGFLDLSGGAYLSRKLHVTYGMGDESMGFVLEGMHLANDGWKELDGGGGTGFARNEWMAKARYSPNPHGQSPHEFLLKLGYADEGSNETYLGLSDQDFSQSPNRRYAASALDRMQWKRFALSLRHTVKVTPTFEVATTVYRQALTRDWNRFKGLAGADVNTVLADPYSAQNQVYYGALTGAVDGASRSDQIIVGPNGRDFLAYGVDSKLRYQAKTGPVSHRYEAGVRLHYDEVERHHRDDIYLMSGGRLTRTADPSVTTADNKGSVVALAGYAIGAISWNRVSLTPGVRLEAVHARYEDRQTNTENKALTTAVLPGVGAYVELTKHLGILGGVNRGFSPPPPSDAKGSRPELSVNYEAGARFSHPLVRAEVIGFYNDYSNITSICTLSTGCSEKNTDKQFDGGSARIYGLEAHADAAIPVARFGRALVRASYTLTESEFRSSFTSDDPAFGSVKAGDYMPYLPTHQFSASLGFDARRFAVNVSGSYVDSMREKAGRGEPARFDRTDAAFVVDASATYRPWKQISFYVIGKNLADSKYIVSHRPFGARPGAPRWVTVGARAEF